MRSVHVLYAIRPIKKDLRASGVRSTIEEQFDLDLGFSKCRFDSLDAQTPRLASASATKLIRMNEIKVMTVSPLRLQQETVIPFQKSAKRIRNLRWILAFVSSTVVVAIIHVQVVTPMMAGTGINHRATTIKLSVANDIVQDLSQQRSYGMDGTKSSSRRPLIVGAGQGTTGTRSTHAALCNLGLKTLHYQNHCHLDTNVTADNTTLEAHQDFYHLFDEFHKDKPYCDDVDVWMQKMKGLIDKVIEGPVDAILDSPYTYFLSYVEEAHIRIRGQPPVIFLTERDPLQWATSRSKKHRPPICKDKASPQFQLFECIQSMRPKIEQQMLLPSNSSTTLGCQHFSSDLRTLRKRSHDNKWLHRVAEAMKADQDWMRSKAAYSVNLFERPNRTSTEELAEELRLCAIPYLQDS